MWTRSRQLVAGISMSWLAADPVGAQVIGTFNWQTQPYCNVVTLTVVQQGGAYQLSGVDNLCGVGVAVVTGTAVPTAGGAQLGFTVVSPVRRASHISAVIDFGTLSGPWVEADGHGGKFAFGASAAGAVRPAPTGGPLRQVVTYSGTTTSAGGTINPPQKLRDLGEFTSRGGPVRLTWTSHLGMTAGGVACNFQLRVDGVPDDAANLAGLTGSEANVVSSNGQGTPVSLSLCFPALGPGTHRIELWLRSVAATCLDNGGNYTRQVVVEEFGIP